MLKLCERFSGRVLVFHFSDLNVDVSLIPDATGVHVTEAESDRADVRLSSDVGGFSRLLTAGERRQAVLDSDVVQVEGDVTLAEQFIRAVESARPDIEEILAPLAGDVVAGRVASQTRQLTGWGRDAAATLGMDAVEYLREERADLVHRADLEDWMKSVDALADDLARLEARVACLATAPDTDSR